MSVPAYGGSTCSSIHSFMPRAPPIRKQNVHPNIGQKEIDRMNAPERERERESVRERESNKQVVTHSAATRIQPQAKYNCHLVSTTSHFEFYGIESWLRLF